jgi:hypothetical protein
LAHSGVRAGVQSAAKSVSSPSCRRTRETNRCGRTPCRCKDRDFRECAARGTRHTEGTADTRARCADAALVFQRPSARMSQDPPAQPVAGGADESGPLATLLARGAGLCADCIEVQTGIPAIEVPVVTARLRETVPVQIVRGRCDVCAAIRTTYRAGPRSVEAIVEFLRQHGGKAFCSACIASSVTHVQDIGAAMRRAEGYGITRQHAKCAACGKTRLVATLSTVR